MGCVKGGAMNSIREFIYWFESVVFITAIT